MQVTALPLLKDNYAWLLTGDGAEAWIVDPSEAEPVQALLEARGLTLAGILLTHHHWDHVGGLPGLLARWPGAEVLASAVDGEKVEGVTRTLDDGEVLDCLGSEVRCLFVPGHTLGAVAYHVPEVPAVFTGDTLFTGGCGRLFEGTAEMMHDSLRRLSDLPEETLVYCGHEYTVSNLRFAAHAEPENGSVTARLAEAEARRARAEATVPASVADERATNPFLRARDAAHFGALRLEKDTF